MKNLVYNITIPNLILSFIPLAVVIGIYAKWSLKPFAALYATIRMVLQLIAIGFALKWIFGTSSPWIVCAILLVMLLFASWIALGPVAGERLKLLPAAFLAISIGGISTLALAGGWVIRLDPWYDARYLIPIAGMIFAQCMNGVSLAADRSKAELARGSSLREARAAALQTALLPITNNFLAVGLVSLPGMMTGQILAGVSPLIAVRYQIMVMAALFGSTGISAALFLLLEGRIKK